jgi:hypothetical protein
MIRYTSGFKGVTIPKKIALSPCSRGCTFSTEERYLGAKLLMGSSLQRRFLVYEQIAKHFLSFIPPLIDHLGSWELCGGTRQAIDGDLRASMEVHS